MNSEEPRTKFTSWKSLKQSYQDNGWYGVAHFENPAQASKYFWTMEFPSLITL